MYLCFYCQLSCHATATAVADLEGEFNGLNQPRVGGVPAEVDLHSCIHS